MTRQEALARLARVESEVEAIRAALTEPEPVEPERAPEWIETWEAAARFDLARDTVRYYARDKGFGQRRAGRWWVDATALRAYLRNR